MLNPCSATKEQKEAWSAVDELLHQQIGAMKTREKKFAEGYVCLTCYRTVEKCMFIFGEFTSNTDNMCC